MVRPLMVASMAGGAGSLRTRCHISRSMPGQRSHQHSPRSRCAPNRSPAAVLARTTMPLRLKRSTGAGLSRGNCAISASACSRRECSVKSRNVATRCRELSNGLTETRAASLVPSARPARDFDVPAFAMLRPSSVRRAARGSSASPSKLVAGPKRRRNPLLASTISPSARCTSAAATGNASSSIERVETVLGDKRGYSGEGTRAIVTRIA